MVNMIDSTGGSAAVDELADARRKIVNLTIALVSSRRIGMAMGILMFSAKIGEDRAFAMLAAASHDEHVKVRDIADRVVLTGTLE